MNNKAEISTSQYCLDIFGVFSDIYELTSLLEFADITHYICNNNIVFIRASIGYVIVNFDLNGQYSGHRYIIGMLTGPIADSSNAKYIGVSLRVGKYYSAFHYANIVDAIHNQIKLYSNKKKG